MPLNSNSVSLATVCGGVLLWLSSRNIWGLCCSSCFQFCSGMLLKLAKLMWLAGLSVPDCEGLNIYYALPCLCNHMTDTWWIPSCHVSLLVRVCDVLWVECSSIWCLFRMWSFFIRRTRVLSKRKADADCLNLGEEKVFLSIQSTNLQITTESTKRCQFPHLE